MPSKVIDILLHSGSKDATSGVDVGYDFVPGRGVRDGKINGVAFPDVT